MRKRNILGVILFVLGPYFLPTHTFKVLGQTPDSTFIIDLHAHPSLKMYLWDEHLWKSHNPGPGDNTIVMQNDVEHLHDSPVRGFLATHYLPEAGIETNWGGLQMIFNMIKKNFPLLANKIEQENSENFKQINTMMSKMEAQIATSNLSQDKVRFVLARNYKAFEDSIKLPGRIVVAHAIEGGHALGRYKPRSKKRKLSDIESSKLQNPNSLERLYINHLEEFKARGVCMMTLSHFFENDISYPVEGISPDQKKKLGMEWNYDPWVDNKPLPDLGITVVKKMLEIGIIVDIAHTTPNVRSDVFKINDERTVKRPIVFSHVGAQGIFEKYNKNPDYDNYKYYCVSDSEILKIKECGGIIGVIPEVFWLTGCNDHLKGCGHKFRNGIEYIIETIEYIHKVSGTYDNIGIGTDFDGLACAPIDLYMASQLKNLISAMEKSGISKEDINKILYKNTQRVLKNGWI